MMSVVVNFIHIFIIIRWQPMVHMWIIMSLERNMPNSFIFIIIFMVNTTIVLPGSGFRFPEFRDESSQSIINKLLFLPSINVHVPDGVNRFFFNFCSCCMSPMCFNPGHMPLIHDCDYCFSRTISVQSIEEVEILLVHKHFFLVGCVFFK